MNEKTKAEGAVGRLQKNDVIELVVDNLGINGEGVARYNGMAIFIKGVLPKEKVRAKVILVKPAFAIAIAEEIIKKSAARAIPKCKVFGKCGGCSLQHLEYGEQLIYKRKKVEETFKKVADLTVSAQPTVPSLSPYNYRNKLSLPVRGESHEVGFFAGGSHRIVPIKECDIQFIQNKRLIELFNEFMSDNGLTGYDETTHGGDVRHFVARELGGVMFVTIVTPRGDLPQIKAFGEILQSEYQNNYALYLNINSLNNNVILGDKTKFISGNSGAIVVDGINIAVHPASFFQVNDYMRKEIYDRVTKLCEGTVLECYSGSGLLSAAISKACDLVVAIEIDSKATDAAKETLKANKISNVRVINGDCAIEAVKVAQTLSAKHITVVLDPPRAGCADSVVNAVTKVNAKRIIYVSCNPATLARDVKIMCEKGYKVVEVMPMDMFPNTVEVETICVMEQI